MRPALQPGQESWFRGPPGARRSAAPLAQYPPRRLV